MDLLIKEIEDKHIGLQTQHKELLLTFTQH